MAYSVVIFEVGENTAETIPSNWLVKEKDQCWWPPDSGVPRGVLNKLIMNCTAPDEQTWAKVPCRYLKDYETYQEAAVGRKRAQELSDIESEFESSGKRKRRLVLPRQESSEEEEPEKRTKTKGNKGGERVLALSQEPPALPILQGPVQDFTPTVRNSQGHSPAHNEGTYEAFDKQASDTNLQELTPIRFNLFNGVKPSMQTTPMDTPVQSYQANYVPPPPAYIHPEYRHTNNDSDSSWLTRTGPDGTSYRHWTPPENVQEHSYNSTHGDYHVTQGDASQHSVAAESNDNNLSQDNRIDQMLSLLKTILDNQKQLARDVAVLKIKLQRGSPQTADIPQSSLLELPNLPCKSVEEAKVLNETLQDPMQYKQVLEFLGQQGGKNTCDSVRRIMPLVLSPKSANSFTLGGTKEKASLEKMQNVMRVISDAVRSLKTLQDAKQTDIREGIRLWLHHSADRLKKEAVPLVPGRGK